MEYEFNDIPIEIDGEVHAVTYRYTETDKYGQAYHIISEGKELIVDKDLKELESTFPGDWKQPAIDRLVALLAQQK
ncbi:hypothetical protein [Parapedobacter defluvii]|uniref:hypothetical protein n=1 Tax=Parapedobacter defluvii TaxID=2045106 RepID=UPI000FAC8946|nr:MAG: hypothetical protein EAS52_04045 [Parapedobacter sp.]